MSITENTPNSHTHKKHARKTGSEPKNSNGRQRAKKQQMQTAQILSYANIHTTTKSTHIRGH